MSESDSECAEVAAGLAPQPPRLSLPEVTPQHYPFLTNASDQELVKVFLEAENAPVPVYIEMDPLDTGVNRDPASQAYEEYTYAIARHLDLFYYRKGLSKPLDEYAEDIYNGWITIFPDPLSLPFVKEQAGDDKEEAAKVLKKALLKDSSLARAQYRWKIANSQDEEGFWKPIHVRSGLVTFEYLVNRTVKFDHFSRWSSQAYVREVKKLKRLKAGIREAQDFLYSYPFLGDPGVTLDVAVEELHEARSVASEGMQKFMRKRIVVHYA
ncbi:hypothetical protein V5O48_008637 [Marasmius crinis-equi]|uniref:Uncharacterized protein n=1 Tax=Marasmius crinis-equi TaxID=585013 RepID=A0ABR3FDH6_9AGAR